MPSGKLPNYLRFHRKRLGFSEKEVAFLLGLRRSSQVSRYEHFHRVPNLMVALAYHVIFRTASPELFGGKFEKVKREVIERAKCLVKKVEAQPKSLAIMRKLLWLRILAGEIEVPAKAMSVPDFPDQRVLAVYPESRGFGYVVFESSRTIIDWGSECIRKDKSRTILVKAGALLDQYAPDVLVLEDCRAAEFRRSRRVVRLLVGVKALADSKDIFTCRIPKLKVRRVFKTLQAETKEEIAHVLADKLPPLSPWLSCHRGRKNDWYRMSVFDAAALALTYFHTCRARSTASAGLETL